LFSCVLLCPGGKCLIGPHECSITRAEKEFRIYEGPKQSVARRSVESPQPLRLRRRQSQTGHFDVLALNALKYVLERLC